LTAFFFVREEKKGIDFIMRNKLRIFVTGALIAASCLSILGCGSSSTDKSAGAKKEIKVGVTAGPHAEVMEEVAKEAAKQGITIKVVEFNDFVQPDKALSDKDLDMNSYQHQPYLDNIVKKQGLKLKSIGKTILMPMAVYSHKYKSLKDVEDGAKVTIPNDPTNGARGLLLIQQAGLIKLKNGNSIEATPADIVENPKHLQFIELDAAQIARSLDDSDVACVNTNYAIPAGLNPVKDSLLVESKESPYACVLAVREGDENNEAYKKVLAVYQSDPIKKFVQDHFKGTIVPAF
jgi:D-methionine transport system substrate-binding protein